MRQATENLLPQTQERFSVYQQNLNQCKTKITPIRRGDFLWLYKLNKNHGNAVYIINFKEIEYHQNEVLYIIIAKAYTPSVMICTLCVMIYSLSTDDMPLLSQWIKKDSPKTVFFGADDGT